jgi:hypothetical protein
MSTDTISIQLLTACKAGDCASCYGWRETDAEKGSGVRCGCDCHLRGGWKFDRIRQAHAELDRVFRVFSDMPPGLFDALRRVERRLTGDA